MAATKATKDKTTEPETNPAESVVPNDPVGENADMTPAERDKTDPPVDDGEAQAQAFAVDQSANLASRPPFPIAAPADEHGLSFEEVAGEIVSSSLVVDELKVLNDKNTELRLAIANRFPNLDVHDIFLRARRDEKENGSYGPLVVEAKLAHGDWTEVKIDR